MAVIHLDLGLDAAVGHLHPCDFNSSDGFLILFRKRLLGIAHMIRLFEHFLDGLDHPALKPVFTRENFHPFGNGEVNLRNREFMQNLFQDRLNVFFFELFAVDRHNLNPVFFLHLLCQFPCFIGIRPHGV